MAEFRAEWDREAQQRRRAAERQSETEDWAIRRATSRLEARGIVSRRPADEDPSVRAEPTAVERAARLTLTWARDEFVVRQGDYPQITARLRNEGTESWSDDRGEYWVIASVLSVDSGEPVAARDKIAIAGVGRTYELPPGGTVDLPVALAAYLDRLLPDTCTLVGHLSALALETRPVAFGSCRRTRRAETQPPTAHFASADPPDRNASGDRRPRA
jgi:hypothetical protein